MSVGSTAEGVEGVRVDIGLIAEQQHQDGQANSRLSSSDGQNEKHKNLSMHIAQVMGERNEVHVHSQQHQFNSHEQDDQILAIQKYTDHCQSKQHCSK